jgi:hypothetical protein
MHKTLGRPKNHGEISRNGVTCLWSVFGGLLSVTAPDGRQKRTQIGGHINAPQALANIMASKEKNQKTDCKQKTREVAAPRVR